ncbi:RNA polymerase I associated factor, A49-like protein [Xylogone sp. PMI_703]|nr:RNA polymerase I associated factor, A49-like protein [Xylogone sp. PMI_703]
MPEEVKKRKRYTDGSSKPSKKLAVEGDRTIKIKYHNTESLAPVVASMSGLAAPNSISFTPYSKPLKSGRSSNIANSELLLHSNTHLKIDYVAREEQASQTDSYLKHYVGVYNPETGELELMEARKMAVRGIVRSQAAAPEEDGARNLRDMRNDLGQTFGTKKAKKAIASVTENAIAPGKAARRAEGQAAKLDSTASAIMASMAEATTQMATKEELAREADAAKPRPAANMDAQDAKDVYTLDSLIGEDILKLVPVLEWQTAVKNKKAVTVNSKFIAERIVPLAQDIRRLRALRYLHCMLSFYTSSKPTRSERLVPKKPDLKQALGDVPEAVVENIRRKFSDGSRMSRFQADLLITHACALALVLDNFETDVYMFKDELKLEMKPMTQYFKEVGATITNMPESKRVAWGLEKPAAAQHKFAKLKVPLKFPEINFARRR